MSFMRPNVPPEPWNARRPMPGGLVVSPDYAKRTFDTRTGTSVSAYYGQGLTFDSDLDQLGAVVDWTITDALARTHDFKRV